MKKNSNKKTKKAKVNNNTSSESKQINKREGEKLYQGSNKKVQNIDTEDMPNSINQLVKNLNPSKLQQAMILSEIIGTPVSRRRNRRGIGR